MSSRRRNRLPPRFHGILTVDKSAGPTSHDVVDAVRALTGQREVGHTGTLDPAATGLLVLCLGEATKIAEYLMRLPKVYEGVMRLGAVSTTQDGDGEITPCPGADPVSLETLRELAQGFLGDIQQVPPLYSAKKLAGKRLYEYARAGESVSPEPRVVTISRFDIHRLEWPNASFEVECGSGTYVRRLVHDLGEDAGCGAYLAALRRLRVGGVCVAEAPTIEALRSDSEGLERYLCPVTKALAHWPRARITDTAFLFLRRGHAFPVAWAPIAPREIPLQWLDPVLIVDAGQRALAVARYVPTPSSPPPKTLSDYRGAWFQPIKQFLIPLA